VNLHQVDSAGHLLGRGPGYDQAVAQADDEIERLVTTLRGLGEWERTVMILLSDHSMDQVPAKVNLESVLEDAGVPAEAFNAVQGDNGMAAHIYLADRESPDRFALLKTMREALAGHPAVSDALYREPNPQDGGKRSTLAREHPGWHVEGERSGDIFVAAKAGYIFASSTGTGNFAAGHHGSNSTRDNFFAVVGGGAELVRQQTVAGDPEPGFDDTEQNPQQAENVDVASTVMGLFGMFAPEDDAGRFLKQAFDKKALRRIARPIDPLISVSPIRKGRIVVRLPGPVGLRDLQARKDGGNWKRLLRRSEETKARVRIGSAKVVRVRARAYSSAGIKSPWVTVSVKPA